MHMKKNNPVVLLKHITKTYVIHHEKPTLVEKFIHKGNESHVALRDVSLTIRKGERIGIIGANGSGKTTLLKIIARITTPTSGVITTEGNIVSLIGLDAGFNEELSGIDNIYLNGMILGMAKKDIQAGLLNIIRYAQLREFIDVPLHTYSLGMQLRLGFSIAMHAKPDILILDEGIDVGDAKFREKARKNLELLFGKKTIILVSHNVYAIADICNRVIIMEKGAIVYDGGLEALFLYDKSIVPELKLYLKLKGIPVPVTRHAKKYHVL